MKCNVYFVIFLSAHVYGNFLRSIEAVGYPYYKILFSIGICKEKNIYKDSRIWGSARLNRVFDIYFKTQKPGEKISRVEIILVINNTDCMAYSKSGIGKPYFEAVVTLPTNVGILFHTLFIFSCTSSLLESDSEEQLPTGTASSEERHTADGDY